jgi:hypothetical protein
MRSQRSSLPVGFVPLGAWGPHPGKLLMPTREQFART